MKIVFLLSLLVNSFLYAPNPCQSRFWDAYFRWNQLSNKTPQAHAQAEEQKTITEQRSRGEDRQASGRPLSPSSPAFLSESERNQHAQGSNNGCLQRVQSGSAANSRDSIDANHSAAAAGVGGPISVRARSAGVVVPSSSQQQAQGADAVHKQRVSLQSSQSASVHSAAGAVVAVGPSVFYTGPVTYSYTYAVVPSSSQAAGSPDSLLKSPPNCAHNESNPQAALAVTLSPRTAEQNRLAGVVANMSDQLAQIAAKLNTVAELNTAATTAAFKAQAAADSANATAVNAIKNQQQQQQQLDKLTRVQQATTTLVKAADGRAREAHDAAHKALKSVQDAQSQAQKAAAVAAHAATQAQAAHTRADDVATAATAAKTQASAVDARVTSLYKKIEQSGMRGAGSSASSSRSTAAAATSPISTAAKPKSPHSFNFFS